MPREVGDEGDAALHLLALPGRRYCRRPDLSPELSLARSFSRPDLLDLPGLLPPRVIRPPDFRPLLSPPPLGARVNSDA